MILLRGSFAAAAVAAAAFLSSCAVGPDFHAPAAPDVDRYTAVPLPARTSSTDLAQGQAQRLLQDRDIPAEWWALFRSPALDALIKQSLEVNPTLQSAMASLRAAKEAVYAQQGKYFPLVQANYSPSLQESPGAISPTLNSSQNPFALYTAQVMVSYTFDAWGLNRRTVESLQALADLQRFQVEAAYLTLTSNVVVAAIQEASLRGQIDATHELIAINRRMLGLLRDQFNVGYASRADLAAQEAALAQIEATLPPLRKQLEIQRDLLAALAGRAPSQAPPQTFRLAALRLPLDLPVSVPAKLVEQRPDVRSAEEQLHSASALIGVATANMLPNLTISANRGYTATDMASLLAGPNIFWTVAGNATQPLFDGFTLLHQRRAAVDAYQQAAWSYRGAVVGALQNVADALRAVQNDADALKAVGDFARAAKISLDLAQQQFTAGNINFITLLNAQQAYQQALLGLVQAQANRLSDTAALFQALGGGWWNRQGAPAPEQKLDVATGHVEPLADTQN